MYQLICNSSQVLHHILHIYWIIWENVSFVIGKKALCQTGGDHSKTAVRISTQHKVSNLCVYNNSTTPNNSEKMWRHKSLPINQGKVTESQQIRLGDFKHKKVIFDTAIGKPWNFLLQDEDSQGKWTNMQSKPIKGY